ncbi:lysophospholipase [Roseomonas sp. NAR14]|uniref:Lysophospholipase n=1 Tax=Roseomonas acroporae TaxID=2937791 RepID=A0A9X2BW96_9PROT|nr:alpha/beta fold hydrolase [Roseomonas acroporae]MCK8787543.1 lysophospholipase [Roseomonas acroporae]
MMHRDRPSAPLPHTAPGRRGLLSLLPALGVAACTPRLIPAGPDIAPPLLRRDALVMPDGALLPMRVWLPGTATDPGEDARPVAGAGVAPATDAPPAGPVGVGRLAAASPGAWSGIAPAAPPGSAPRGTPTAPRAVVLALHGFNDSRNFMELPAPDLTRAGIAVYAYDQRGFGGAPHRGIWPGPETLARDAAAAARLVGARHPGVPLFLMGESMGGAVLMLAATLPDPPRADGIVLLAPAVWGRETMSPAMRWVLRLAAHTIPLVGFGGSAGGITPTDNDEALLRLWRDPLTIRNTRVDAAWGLLALMDAAVAAAPRFGLPAADGRPAPPALFLYGARDELVPERATLFALDAMPGLQADRRAAESVAGRDAPGRGGAGVPGPAMPAGAGGGGSGNAAPLRLGYYEEGYHFLLRDRNAAAVLRDVVAWIGDRDAPLPSGADAAAAAWLARVQHRPG